MVAKCKVCEVETNNGTNFCSRKHHRQWIRAYNRSKQDWRRIARDSEEYAMTFGSGFNNDDYLQ